MLSFSHCRAGFKCPCERADTTKFLLKCKQLIQALFLKSSFGNGRGTRLGHRAEDSLGRDISATSTGSPALSICFVTGLCKWQDPQVFGDGLSFSSASVQSRSSPGSDTKHQVISCHQSRKCRPRVWPLAEVLSPPFRPRACRACIFLCHVSFPIPVSSQPEMEVLFTSQSRDCVWSKEVPTWRKACA